MDSFSINLQKKKGKNGIFLRNTNYSISSNELHLALMAPKVSMHILC